MTPQESKDFTAVFEFAAQSLPTRVFRGRVLEWRPSMREQASSLLKEAKAKFNDALDSVKGIGGSVARGGGSWQAAVKPAGPARGPSIGGHRAGGSSLGDLKTAISKASPTADVAGLIREGLSSGFELGTLSKGEVKPTMALGYKPDASPEHEALIGGLADAVKDSGIFEAAGVDAGQVLAMEVAGALPIIGAVVNLGSAVKNGIMAGIKWSAAREVQALSSRIMPGNPRAAALALKELLNRKRTEYAIRAAMDGSAGAVQTAGLFVDLGGVTGPAVGIAHAAAKVAHLFFLAIRNFREFRAANRVLCASGPYDKSLLDACPLLGCYLLTEAETSTLIAFLADGRLPVNWMDQVEALKPELQNLLRLANECQRAAPFRLRGAGGAPGSLKGDHFLDFRFHKGVERFAHEAKLVVKRDPRGLRFLGQHLRAKMGL